MGLSILPPVLSHTLQIKCLGFVLCRWKGKGGFEQGMDFGAGLEQRVSFNFLRQLCDADRFKPSAARGRASDSLFCHNLSAQPNPGEELAQLGEISSKLSGS